MEKSTGENEVSITKITVKKENLNDDIKEFAQNAMTELLGWYGYENSRDELRISRNCRASHSGSNSSGLSPKPPDACGWCGKPIDDSTAIHSGTSVFCTELCFSQSRRANFKKNKTCDWCRHVRHTISYVDFHDGASQLQFCSDKCLNQYKMHIFCRETRAHLELHPHLRLEESSSGTLITPDLWLKNCKSPELRSPSPDISPTPPETLSQTSPLSLTHPSKLIDPTESRRNRMKSQRKVRKRLPSTITCSSASTNTMEDAPQDLRIRQTPTDFDSTASEPVFKPIKLPLEPRVPSPKPEIGTVPIPTSNLFRKPFDSLIPPPTVMVPYPLILPIPIPIPIPIPLPIEKEIKKEVEMKDGSSQTEEEKKIEPTGHIGVNGKEDAIIIERSLRKRKKTYGSKPRIVMKPKKVIISTN